MHGFVQNVGRTTLTFFAELGRIACSVSWLSAGYLHRLIIGSNCSSNHRYWILFTAGCWVDHFVFRHGSSPSILPVSPGFSAEDTVATVVVLSVTRELGPVLAGLMVAGRIGASMAAEIGTMRVTDQIDALDTLSTRPMQYLVAPRLLAGTICLPFLVLVGDIIGVFGGISWGFTVLVSIHQFI